MPDIDVDQDTTPKSIMDQLPPDSAVQTESGYPPDNSNRLQDTTPAKGDTEDASAATEGDDADGSKDQKSASDNREGKERPNGNARRKIRKLNKQIAELKAQSEADATELAQVKQKLSDLERSQSAGEEPQLEDFKDPKEYAKAWAKWDADKAVTTTEPNSSRSSDSNQSKDPEPNPDIVDFHERGTERHGDAWGSASKVQIPVTQETGEFLIDSDYGTDVYIHLANNPKLAEKISTLEPREALRELSRLEMKAETGKLLPAEGEVVKKSSKTKANQSDSGEPTGSRAPKPPSDTSQSGTPALEPDLDSMSMDDFAVQFEEMEKRMHRF